MLRRKNILYLVPSTGFGGAETFLLHTAKYHDEEAFNATYLCFRDGPLVESLKKYGKMVLVLKSVPRLRNPLSVTKAIFEIISTIQLQKIDLIHSTMSYGAIFGSIAAKITRKPHVWFQHGPVVGWLDRLATFLSAKTIYVNSKYTEKMQKEMGEKSPLQILTLGVDMEGVQEALALKNTRQEIRANWNIDENTFLVGIACRPQKQKGLELFLDAIHGFIKIAPAVKIKAVIIGMSSDKFSELSEYEKEIYTYATRLNIPLLIQQAKNNIFAEIRALDLLVSSSIYPETFGLTLVESLAIGTPIIAPNEGGPLDIIRDRENGFLFEARNARDLTAKIKLVHELSKPEKIILKCVGMKDSESRFQAKETVKKIEQSYQSLWK